MTIKLRVHTDLISFILLLLITNTVLLLLTPRISAQTEEFSVSPAIIERVIEPGKQTLFTVVVSNNYNQARPMIIEIREPLNIDGTFLNEQYIADDWIIASEESFIIPSGDSKTIDFIIDTPEDESSGGRYATIVFRTLQLSNSASLTGTAVLPEIQVPVLMTVPGDIIEKFDISLEDQNQFFVGKNTNQITNVNIYNSGNIHNLIKPEFVVSDKDGSTMVSRDINPTIILPGSSRTFPVEWTTPNDPGQYYEQATVDFGSPSKSVATEKNRFINGQPLNRIIILSITTWTAMYIFFNHKRLKKSFYVLFLEQSS